MSDVEVKEQLAELQSAVAVLTDGKWEWHKDMVAIGTVAGAAAGLFLAGVEIVQRLGLFG